MCFLSSRCHMSCVDEEFHQLSYTPGKADWSIAVSLRLVLDFLSMGIMVASLQICGTVPVLHPLLNSCWSFFWLQGQKFKSISSVSLSGPGASLDFSVVCASSSSSVTKGEFIVGSSWWSEPVHSLISLFLSVRTCMSMVSAQCLTKMLAARLPRSFPSCSRMICELLVFSSLRAATRFQSFLPSRSRLSYSVFSCQVLRQVSFGVLQMLHSGRCCFLPRGFFNRFLASFTASSCCWNSSVQ